MLKQGKINPLNVHNMRMVEHVYEHFTPVYFHRRTSENNIANWIYENLEGRFCLTDHYYLEPNGNLGIKACAAFELPGEASYFAMLLEQVNRNR